ncbi:MAG: hypothetical protein D4S02_04575, partial [Rhodocyclaceae bacterium]
VSPGSTIWRSGAASASSRAAVGAWAGAACAIAGKLDSPSNRLEEVSNSTDIMRVFMVIVAPCRSCMRSPTNRLPVVTILRILRMGPPEAVCLRFCMQ